MHVFSPDGLRVSFTYEDEVLSRFGEPGDDHDINQRNIGISWMNHPVEVPGSHPRNQSGTAFSVLVTRTVSRPRPGTDEYNKAFEEAWIGKKGYLRHDGTRQRHALAFQAQARTSERQVNAYRKLKRHLDAYLKIQVLEFTTEAATEFERLQRLRPRIGTMDLRIAAIALVHDATVLTKNAKDFSRVPNLRIEDWTS